MLGIAAMLTVDTDLGSGTEIGREAHLVARPGGVDGDRREGLPLDIVAEEEGNALGPAACSVLLISTSAH